METYYKRFKDHVQPKLNPIFARYKFNNEVQNQDTIDAFVTRLRLSARDCSFDKADEMIRDRIVFGTSSPQIRAKLINVGAERTLEKAIQIAQSWEYSQAQLRAMGGATAQQEVHTVRRQGNSRQNFRRRARTTTNRQSGSKSSTNNCGNCGSSYHKSGALDCPAKGKKCHACGKLNHFSKLCRSVKKVHYCDIDSKNVNQCASEQELSNEFEDFYVDTVSHSCSDRAFVELNVGPAQTPISFKIDTGSSANILPVKHYRQLSIPSPLEPSEHRLTYYTGDMLPVTGKITLPCKHNDMQLQTTFYVVESSAPPLISLQTSVDLGLVKLTYSIENVNTGMSRQDVLDEYADLFQGIGLFPGTCKLHLKPDAVPVINPPRRILEALRDRV